MDGGREEVGGLELGDEELLLAHLLRIEGTDLVVGEYRVLGEEERKSEEEPLSIRSLGFGDGQRSPFLVI